MILTGTNIGTLILKICLLMWCIFGSVCLIGRFRTRLFGRLWLQHLRDGEGRVESCEIFENNEKGGKELGWTARKYWRWFLWLDFIMNGMSKEAKGKKILGAISPTVFDYVRNEQGSKMFENIEDDVSDYVWLWTKWDGWEIERQTSGKRLP